MELQDQCEVFISSLATSGGPNGDAVGGDPYDFHDSYHASL